MLYVQGGFWKLGRFECKGDGAIYIKEEHVFETDQNGFCEMYRYLCDIVEDIAKVKK